MHYAQERPPTPIHVLMIADAKQDYQIKRALGESDLDCQITWTPCDEDTLEHLQDSTFDVVLLDCELSGINGLEIIQQIIAQGIDIPIIFVSGVNNESVVVKALKFGAQDYLIKDHAEGYLKLLPTVIRKAHTQWQYDLARKRTEETLRQRNREQILLNRVSQELTATLDPQQVIERLLPAVTEITRAEGTSIWLLDKEKKKELTCQTFFYHGQKHSALNLCLSPGQGVAGWVAETGESVIVPYTPNDTRFFPGIDEMTGFRTISLLAVPLWVRHAIIGVLEVVNKQGGNFDDHDRALVEMLAASAAIAIDNAKLVEALRGYAAELESNNEELDAFAHTTAHELKGSLGYIVGFAQTLEKDYDSLSEEELQRYLRTIAQSGRKMSNIIDELLLLASVRKLEEIEILPLDMASIVTEAQNRLTDSIEEYQAEIILPDAWPTAIGYGPWIEEVWINYLSNALKYGGRPLRVELGASSPSTPSVGGEVKEGMVRFWVRDNGPGLTAEEQSWLFKPFTRLAQAHAKGYGLGLSIVQRIVEKLGGEVGVESKMGQGSVFSFTLPLSNPPQAEKRSFDMDSLL